MIRYYKTQSGELIKCNLNDWRVVVYDLDGLDKVIFRSKVEELAGVKCFNYRGEIIPIDDFEYKSLDELILEIEEASKPDDATHRKHYIPQEEALCTFIKEADNLGFVMPAEYAFRMSPVYNCKDHTVIEEVLVIPDTKNYNTNMWHYKIGVKPTVELPVTVPLYMRTYYFDDLWHEITHGIIKVVNLAKYKGKQSN